MKKPLYCILAIFALCCIPAARAQNFDCELALDPVLEQGQEMINYTTGGQCANVTSAQLCQGNAVGNINHLQTCMQAVIPSYCNEVDPHNTAGCQVQAQNWEYQWISFYYCLNGFAPDSEWFFCNAPGGWPQADIKELEHNEFQKQIEEFRQMAGF